MAKYLGIVAFACLCFWVAFILLAGRPMDRVNRICLPTQWTITTFSAVGALFSPRGEVVGHAFGTDLHQSCRFLAFRVFYSDLYRELQARERARREQGFEAPADNETTPEETTE